MSPAIVYGPEGKPLLALGWAGGKRIIMQVAKSDRRARLRPVGGG
jgi:gamma-glutamyltranspeptidase/glutathione hydrolase